MIAADVLGNILVSHLLCQMKLTLDGLGFLTYWIGFFRLLTMHPHLLVHMSWRARYEISSGELSPSTKSPLCYRTPPIISHF